MDTSQLMNHVVHRQLCYTFFTQVPIEPFFQLGLDFLFAGSHQLFQRGIGPQPAVVDGPPGQAQLFADLAVRHLEEQYISRISRPSWGMAFSAAARRSSRIRITSPSSGKGVYSQG